MYKSEFFKKTDGKIRCTLCPHSCLISEGDVGVCGVRGNIGGDLIALNYGRLVAINNDPIEKKPLFHFLPSSKSLSIATIGCNLFCLNCQNFSISQVRAASVKDRIYGEYYSPKDIVDIAIKNHSESISYTYTEPTVFADYAIDVIEQSKEMKSQLYHVFVTNGYMSDELISRLEGLLDAANIDLKSFSDEFYKKVCKARLAPVLNTIKQFFNMNIHIEITTLLIPTLNDSDEELEKIAEFIASISPDIPWHISRYHPDYKLDISSTPTESISRAREIGRKSGLKFVYSGNIWGDEGENTYCPNCNKLLIRRVGFSVIENNISNSCCKFCNAKVYGRFSK